VRRQRDEGEGLHRLVKVEETGELVGAVGVQGLRTGRPDVGYWTAAPFRRRGLMTAAVRLWVAQLDLPYLEVLTDRDNVPSQRLALAAGFTRSGEVRRDPRPGLAGEFLVFTRSAATTRGH
jgi:RimJ/RimL family protein N-acetyltransferase